MGQIPSHQPWQSDGQGFQDWHPTVGIGRLRYSSFLDVRVNDINDDLRFAADRMLARLARWLRLCGVDVTHDSSLGGAELLHAARRDQRFVLTRDKRLRTAPDALYLRSEKLREQLHEVLHRFGIDPAQGALTRCSRCNHLLHEVDRERARTRVPPYVFQTQDRFCECPGCGKIYWRATHPERILAEIARIEPPQGTSR